jgi:hypothetical protein
MLAADSAEPTAVRLHFSLDGDELRLVDHQVLVMRAPPPDTLHAADSIDGIPRLSGFWIELRNQAGRPLYRRVLHDPLRYWTEAPNEDGSRTKKSVRHPRTTFSVVVPALESATTVLLIGSPRSHPRSAARELARFDLPGRR